jgi:hypothetical protein
MKIQRCFAGLFPYAAVALTACGAGPSATDNATSGEGHVGTVSQAITYNPQAVPHSNTSKRVFMHYMPWFEANGVQHGYTRTGSYGSHWTMANCMAQTNGLLNHICADDTPLIGPYSSSDPYVIEYHLLLMKYSGIDGVVLDWGGVMDNGTDLPGNKINGEAMMAQLSNFGLKFQVMMEDRNYVRNNGPNDFANPVNIPDDTNDMANDLKCLKANSTTCGNLYFGSGNYEKLPGTNTPVVGVFGPTTYRVAPPPPNSNDAYVWDNAYAQAGLSSSSTAHYTLWWQDADISNEQDGSSAWVWAGTGAVGNSSWSIEDHMNYYVSNETAPGSNRVKMGAVVPAYYAYYQAGGWNADAASFSIPFNGGSNVDQLFDIVLPSNANYVQMVTWNDFGEGTEFEPTVNKQYTALVETQKKLGAPYEVTQLQLIKRLFDARVTARKNNDSTRQAQLDQASAYLAQRDVSAAQCIIDGCPVTGASSPTTAGGYYELMNVNSGKCFDLPNGSTADGATYDQKTCDQSNKQRFALWGGPNGTYYIENIGDWKCVELSNGSLVQKTCSWSTAGQFYIEDKGGYQMQIRSAAANSCFDVYGGSTADGATTGLWTCGSQTNQSWILRGTTGELRDTSTWAAICVHPLGGSSTPADNTNAVLWNDCSTMDRIRYTLRNDGNLQQVSSGECLNAFTGVAKAGQPLVFYNSASCGNPANSFRQLPNGAMQHKQTGLCLHRQNSVNSNGTNIIFSTTCDAFSLDP